MDSNHRSLRRRIYSPFPLTTRAPTHNMVTQEGLEPPTLWFVVKYSNPAELLSHVKCGYSVCYQEMVGPPGLEPGTDRLWAGCSNQLSYRPNYLIRRIWSGKRDSNSRPPPWQGDALPTELFPHIYCVCQCSAWLTRTIIHFSKNFVNTFLKKI